jgi:hypothetical protein
MNTINQPRAGVQIDVEDPATGETHTFTGATETEAISAAEAFFGVDEAQEREND